jgi:erythromycin esterase
MRYRSGLASGLFCVVFAGGGCGHGSGEGWIQSNHQAIRSANPSDTDFSDLQFLKQAIGDRRVVQLGESAHGTAEFSSMKVRLIKFLHEEMGFDVVAFESGLFDCYRANERMDSRSAYQTMRDCTFGVWHTAEAAALFEYLQSTRTDSAGGRAVRRRARGTGSRG